MDQKRKELLKVVNESLHETMQFRNKIKTKKEELPDINEIKRQLTTIGKVVNELISICQSEIYALDDISKVIKYFQTRELTDEVDEMLEIIKANLPNGMEVSNEETIDDTGNRQIFLRYNDIECIGQILIRNEDRGFFIEVSIKDDEVAKYEIENPYRVYNLISFINTKINYD